MVKPVLLRGTDGKLQPRFDANSAAGGARLAAAGTSVASTTNRGGRPAGTPANPAASRIVSVGLIPTVPNSDRLALEAAMAAAAKVLPQRRALAQGLALNLADEAGAGMDAWRAQEAYDQDQMAGVAPKYTAQQAGNSRMAAEEFYRKKFAHESPLQSNLLELAGGAPWSLLGGGGAAAKGVQTASSLTRAARATAPELAQVLKARNLAGKVAKEIDPLKTATQTGLGGVRGAADGDTLKERAQAGLAGAGEAAAKSVAAGAGKALARQTGVLDKVDRLKGSFGSNPAPTNRAPPIDHNGLLPDRLAASPGFTFPIFGEAPPKKGEDRAVAAPEPWEIEAVAQMLRDKAAGKQYSRKYWERPDAP